MSVLPDTIIKFKALEDKLSKLGIPGDMRLFPFRANALPAGWYHMNGDKYALTSAQGIVLDGFTATFKADWKITVASSLINLPTMYASDGRAYFERAVDGVSRQVGSEEGDAIRNITGAILDMQMFSPTSQAYTGAFTKDKNVLAYNYQFQIINQSNVSICFMPDFDASRVVPTAPENRVLNIGKTPAIYLGV